MQLISTGLSYVALRADNHNLERITVSSQQRDALSLSWVSLLQARNTLNRAGTRAALKVPQEQVDALMGGARSSLQKKPISIFNQFLDTPRADEQEQQLADATRDSYEKLRGELRELIVFLEKSQPAGLYGPADAEKYRTASRPTLCNICSWRRRRPMKPAPPVSRPTAGQSGWLPGRC